MAGVAGHSGSKGDPWGRLQRTSTYLAATTNGTASPSACGQVMTITVTMRSRENSNAAPKLNQAKRVSNPTLMAI